MKYLLEFILLYEAIPYRDPIMIQVNDRASIPQPCFMTSLANMQVLSIIMRVCIYFINLKSSRYEIKEYQLVAQYGNSKVKMQHLEHSC